MQYRVVPKTGEKISTLGYGTMRLPTKAGRIDVEKTKQQILYAIDQGVNYLDTAWFYHMGASESFLGEHILQGEYRNKVNVATKLPCFLITKASQFEEIFEKQLRKLQIDTIDYYLLHALDGETFIRMVNMGVLDFITKLKKDGKVRNLGFSFHGTHQEFIDIIDAYDWDFCQVQYNIIDEYFQAGIEGIKYAYQKKIAVFVMEPLRGGALVGKMPPQVDALYKQSKTKRSSVDWALSWILNHPEVTMLLSGMNDIDHIKENIEIASKQYPNTLTDLELDMLASVKDTYDSLLTVKCTACNYCMPCPKGIQIPDAFKALNDKHMFKSRLTKYMYVRAISFPKRKVAWASTCIDCKKCVKHCPQHINIPSELKKVSKELERIDSKIVSFLAKKLKK